MRCWAVFVVVLVGCAGPTSTPAVDAGPKPAPDAGPAVSGHNCADGCWDGAHCQYHSPAACGTGDAPTCTVCRDPGPCRVRSCPAGACVYETYPGNPPGIHCGTNGAFLCSDGACGECLGHCEDAHQTCLAGCHDAACPGGCDQAQAACKGNC